MLITQALYTLTLVCSASLLLDSTRYVSLESVVAAFPIRLLSSLLMERLSVMVDPKCTNSRRPLVFDAMRRCWSILSRTEAWADDMENLGCL